MARAAADSLGTHTMKQFNLTFGDVELGATVNNDEAFDVAPASVHGALDALAVGETVIDEDGDTWERIA